MHVVLAYKPILVDVVFEHVKINSMKKQKIKVQQHNTGKKASFGNKVAAQCKYEILKPLIMAYGMKA